MAIELDVDFEMTVTETKRISLEVECAICGGALETTYYQRLKTLCVAPCQNCIAEESIEEDENA